MKKQIYLLASLLLILSVSFTSCGPSKKIVAADAKYDKLQKENANNLSQLSDCNTQVKNLKAEKVSIQNANDSVLNDLKALSLESKMFRYTR